MNEDNKTTWIKRIIGFGGTVFQSKILCNPSKSIDSHTKWFNFPSSQQVTRPIMSTDLEAMVHNIAVKEVLCEDYLDKSKHKLFIQTNAVVNIAATSTRAKNPKKLNIVAPFDKLTIEQLIEMKEVSIVALPLSLVNRTPSSCFSSSNAIDDKRSGGSFDKTIILNRICDSILATQQECVQLSKPFTLKALKRFKFDRKMHKKQNQLLLLINSVKSVLINKMDLYFPALDMFTKDFITERYTIKMFVYQNC